jgi:sporulation protein YlmC with PRC-barrel domain
MSRRVVARTMLAMRLELGKPVRASDGEVVGELADVIIDPTQKRLTHLVVKPHHDADDGLHLVPIDLAVAGDEGNEISLRSTAAEVRQLPNVQDFAYLRVGEVPVSDPEWDVGIKDVLALPYYDGGLGGLGGGGYDEQIGVVYDRIPKGEVEIRRASSITSADGHYLGEVDGFLVDDDHITHLVLERGHLWGRREVTIPINLVAGVESDAVTLTVSKDEVGELPEHKVHRWSLHRHSK